MAQTDAMVTHEQLAVYDAGARDLPGGHNAMVENPGAVWDWIDDHDVTQTRGFRSPRICRRTSTMIRSLSIARCASMRR